MTQDKETLRENMNFDNLKSYKGDISHFTQEQQAFLNSIYEKNFISVDNIHEEPYESTANDNHILLTDDVMLGEYKLETNAKPGNYFITLISRENDDHSALLYVHTDTWEQCEQDFNNLIDDLDWLATDVIDGGSYGLSSGDQVDFNPTNYGDGDMTIYTNKDHSAFLFDDTQLISKLYTSDFEDFFTNRQEFEFWSDSDKFIFNIYDEHKFTVEPDKNERMFDAAIRQIISYFQEKNNTLSDIHNTNEDIKSNELSTNELSDLHKSLEDLQREAIAEEMSNLL